MEGSNRSAVSESLSHKGAVASSREESGWTEYLEDFMASEERGTSGGSCSSDVSADAGGSSLVSDAASCVLPWKASPAAFALQGSSGCKKLKRRTRLGDKELEDTASSPVSSPKVNDLNRFDVNARKKDDVKGISQEKESLAAENLSETQRAYEGINEMDFGDQIRPNNNRIKLKKKGLRLVPMSMLVHYLG
ncbi:hypothetical protein Taro_006075 [Colocasia esculenta]|uniref:Uncharacterized protein n=1 Tax=Colocasia esculenta TaxID=4460 RepID=A0A843TWH6_COLES|nr:hypothetical protein [Colocasia esculenta]